MFRELQFYTAFSFLFCFQYGIKKKEEEVAAPEPDVEGRLGRKKKTPAEMAAEAAAAEEEEDSNDWPSCCCPF